MPIEERLRQLGIVLPAKSLTTPGFPMSFAWTRVHGDRVLISGHSPQHADGSPAGPYGKVPSEVSLEDAREAARQTAFAMLGSLERELGDLDRITAWLTVTGMVNADPGYGQTTLVINGFSDCIVEVFGPRIGSHARTAAGVAALPLNNAVVIAAEVAIRP